MTSLSSLRPDGTQVTVPVPALLFAHSGIDSSMLCNGHQDLTQYTPSGSDTIQLNDKFDESGWHACPRCCDVAGSSVASQFE